MRNLHERRRLRHYFEIRHGSSQRRLFYGHAALVVVIGALNAIVTPLMYFPALRLFVSRGILDSLEEQEVASDHSMYELKPTQEGLISMEHLSYIYNKQKTPVLDDVNLTVQKGDFLVITGESGSGKSSLCMAMTGAIPHYFGGVMKGMVYVNVRRRRRRRFRSWPPRSVPCSTITTASWWP
mgnify:CR=1 FL=1